MGKSLLRGDIPLIFLFVLLAAWIRIYGLDNWYWSPDDALHLSYAVAAQSVPELLQMVLHHNTHSPGFFLLPYFMSKISEAPLFLRTVSLVPGLALIPIFYYLGKEYKGRIAAITMAFTAAFAQELVLISETIRQYSLLLCLISLSLYILFRYDKKQDARLLYVYAFLSFIAINIHYTAVIVIFALGLVWGARMLAQKRHLVMWMFNHLLLAAFFLFLLYVKKSTATLEGDLAMASGEWMKSGFPGHNMSLWIRNGFMLLVGNSLTFHTVPSLFLNIGLLAGGVTTCLRHKERYIIILLLLLLACNIALTSFQIYPFTEGRWCIYTLPFILLPMAHALTRYIHYCQALYTQKKQTGQWDEKADIFTTLILLILYQSHLPFNKTSGYMLVGCFILLAVINAKEEQFFRPTSVTNFPLTVQEYHQFKQQFMTATTAGDYVITDRYFLNYLFYELHSRNDKVVRDDVHSLDYHGRTLFYMEGNSGMALRHLYEVRHIVDVLKEYVPDSEEKTLWFASVGWRAAIYKMATPVFAPTYWREEEDKVFSELAWKLFLSGNINQLFINGTYGGGVIFTLPWKKSENIFDDLTTHQFLT